MSMPVAWGTNDADIWIDRFRELVGAVGPSVFDVGAAQFRSEIDLSDNDTKLLFLTPYDALTIGDFCEGVHVFGGTGSGKSSGSGQNIAKAFLRSGCGGLVLTAKPDERAQWERYASACGREQDLIVFSPDEAWRFNFLDYEQQRDGRGGGKTENIVNLFVTLMETLESGQQAAGGDQYWMRSTKQLLRNAVDLSRLALGQIDLKTISDIINSAPQSIDEARQEPDPARRRMSWQERSKCFELLLKAGHHVHATGSDIDQHDFERTSNYWLSQFPRLASKTRSIIVSMFTSMADTFLRGDMYRLFCNETNVTPELCFEQGKILLIDMPVKEWNVLGVQAQVIWKYVWQLAAERRQDKQSPAFLWADEAQLFFTSYDQEFMTTARSSRIMTVYLTQNMPNYLASIGDNRRSVVDSFLGNFQTKIFHQNDDVVTNSWAADTIGKDIVKRRSWSSSETTSESRTKSESYSEGTTSSRGTSTSDGSSKSEGFGGEISRFFGMENNAGRSRNTGSGTSESYGRTSTEQHGTSDTTGRSTSEGTGEQEQIDYLVPPISFKRLLKGGIGANLLVYAIVVRGGHTWSDGLYWLPCRFAQQKNRNNILSNDGLVFPCLDIAEVLNLVREWRIYESSKALPAPEPAANPSASQKPDAPTIPEEPSSNRAAKFAGIVLAIGAIIAVAGWQVTALIPEIETKRADFFKAFEYIAKIKSDIYENRGDWKKFHTVENFHKYANNVKANLCEKMNFSWIYLIDIDAPVSKNRSGCIDDVDDGMKFAMNDYIETRKRFREENYAPIDEYIRVTFAGSSELKEYQHKALANKTGMVLCEWKHIGTLEGEGLLKKIGECWNNKADEVWNKVNVILRRKIFVKFDDTCPSNVSYNFLIKYWNGKDWKEKMIPHWNNVDGTYSIRGLMGQTIYWGAVNSRGAVWYGQESGLPFRPPTIGTMKYGKTLYRRKNIGDASVYLSLGCSG